jgi:hypothetical protein
MSVFEENAERFRERFGFEPSFETSSVGCEKQFVPGREVHCKLQEFAQKVASGKAPRSVLESAVESAATCQAIPQAWNGEFRQKVEEFVCRYLEAAAEVDSEPHS